MDVVTKTIEACCNAESHAEHLCYLLSQGFNLDDAQAYEALVRNPRFRCGHCGRTAASPQNLCHPTPL